MDVLRCVLITAEEHIWKNTAQYLSKRCSKYNWIVNRPKDSEKSEVEVFVWWDGKGVFSATPLRSYLKSLKQKNHKECFKISKAVKTKSIVRKLVDSTKTHYWDDGFVGKELMEYLKVRILELRRKLKVTGKTEQQKEPQSNTLKVTEKMEVTEQESGPQPSTSQQSDLQPLKVTEKMNTEVAEQQNESDTKVDKKRVRLSQNQINGLVLKLLSRTTSNVTNVSKDITDVSGKVKRLNEAFCTEMVKVNSKMDKLAETLNHKLYDPLFDDDCKCNKCIT